MAELRGEEVVFVGLGKSVPSWYRCALPAYHLGARWIGYSGEPPRGEVATGNTFAQALHPGEARVWILQQPRGARWLSFIRQAKRDGAKVLYEVDDYLHGVARLAASDGDSIPVTSSILREFEDCMHEADGIICSTEYIASQYCRYNRTWVCRNGIDTARFSRAKVDRPQPNVGWFGGFGHEGAVRAVSVAVGDFVAEHDLLFYSIGHQYPWADVPRDRLVRIPFVGLEQVPDVLAHLDIGIAPWEDTDFHRGKSDLRVLEGAAAGVAMLADFRGYGTVPGEACWFTDDGYDGWRGGLESLLFTTPDSDEADSIAEPAWQTMPPRARAWVERERDASVTAADWEIPLNEISKEM